MRKRRDHKDYDPYEVAAHWRIDAAKAKKMGAAMPADRWGNRTERKRYRPDAPSDELATKLKGMTKQRGNVTIVWFGLVWFARNPRAQGPAGAGR